MAINVTANGDYLLVQETITPTGNYSGTGTSVIMVSGTFGTATATLKYKDLSGNFVALENGTLEVNKQYVVEHGKGVDLYVTIATADGSTDIDISVGEL